MKPLLKIASPLNYNYINIISAVGVAMVIEENFACIWLVDWRVLLKENDIVQTMF